MSLAHQRKKQPDVLREQLLLAAARLAIQQGVQGISIEAVASLAGVSKGGLQHHFRSKQALLDALFERAWQDFLAALNAAIAADPCERGRATRAYVRVTAGMAADEEPALWSALTIIMLADAALRARWSAWIQAHTPLDAAASEEEGAALLLCRLAADGLYLNDLQGCHHISPSLRAATLRQLEHLSYGKNPP